METGNVGQFADEFEKWQRRIVSYRRDWNTTAASWRRCRFPSSSKFKFIYFFSFKFCK